MKASPVPIAPEAITGLWFTNRAKGRPFGLEQASQSPFRPEGRDVRSRIADVVPEMARRYQEVNEAQTAHRPLRGLEPQLLSCRRRMRVERAALSSTGERKDRKAIPDAVREPPPVADL